MIMTEKKDEILEDQNTEKQADEEVPEKPEDEEVKAEDVTEEKEDEKDEQANTEEEESFEKKYLRMAADFQNFKRRTDEEKSRIYTNANERFASDLLEVLDNFERAIEQDRIDDADKQFLEGMELILKQLQDVLKKNGVEEIEALGTEFDPNFHHAIAMESSDKFDKGCVTEVMQKGYRLKDRIIRPAMVKVAE